MKLLSVLRGTFFATNKCPGNCWSGQLPRAISCYGSTRQNLYVAAVVVTLTQKLIAQAPLFDTRNDIVYLCSGESSQS